MERKLLLRGDVLKYLLELVTNKKYKEIDAITKEQQVRRTESEVLRRDVNQDVEKLVKVDLKNLICEINQKLKILSDSLELRIERVWVTDQCKVTLEPKLNTHSITLRSTEFSEEVVDRINRYRDEQADIEDNFNERACDEKAIRDFLKERFSPKCQLISMFRENLTKEENQLLEQLMRKMNGDVNDRYGITVIEEDTFFTEQPVEGTI